MTQLNLAKDIQGYPTKANYFSSNIYTADLTNATEDSITVPNTKATWLALLTYESQAELWVAVNATAAAPAGGTFAAQANQFLPNYGTFELRVKAGDTISVFNNGSSPAQISIALYELLPNR